MKKYTEFLENHTNSPLPEYKDIFKQEMDEVIEERLYKFRKYYNETHEFCKVSSTEILKFLQNKEE